MTSPLDLLFAAKEARDVVRNTLVKAIRERVTVDAEISGLLRCDEIAEENLKLAVEAYKTNPYAIPDSTT